MLKIRQQREDERKRVVAERIAQIAEVQQELARLEQLTNDGAEQTRQAQAAGRIDMQQSLARRGWLAHLHKATLDAQARLRGLEARLAQERVLLAEAAKQRRILEKLQERQYERHRMEEQKAEARAIDDLVTTRFVFDSLQGE